MTLAPVPNANAQPADDRCEVCSARLPWTWLDHPAMRAWVPPVQPCPDCRGEAEEKARSTAWQLACRRAGIAERYLNFRLAEAVVVEGLPRTRDPGVLYVPAEAMDVWTWAQGYQGKASALLEGPPGSGKTLWACVVASHLLAAPLELVSAERRLPDGRVVRGMRRRGGLSVVVVQEAELISALRRRRSGYSTDVEHPLDRCKTCSVLIIDDLGAMGRGRQGEERWEAGVVEELVDARYRENRPIVATTNLDGCGLRDVLGARTASRLDELVGPDRFKLRADWRHVSDRWEDA